MIVVHAVNDFCTNRINFVFPNGTSQGRVELRRRSLVQDVGRTNALIYRQGHNKMDVSISCDSYGGICWNGVCDFVVHGAL